ncbi:MAG: NAD(P)H-hydrate dehydratase [Deltaproteobacteria bacterium]|nr:NAD(P)H-hydrate dehydratase [Deltaproteobacteria bacterium]
MKLATASQMREIDRHAIEEVGIPGIVLMENAGAGCARVLMERYEAEADTGVCVVCGTGNNGGDGFVIARHLWNNGFPVEVFVLGRAAQIKGDAKTNFEILEKLDVPVTEVVNDDDAELMEAEIDGAGVVVDAIFGTGLDREVAGTHRRAIDAINASGAKVVAVDMPSGLDSDSGRLWGVAVFAEITCTFGIAKIGQYTHPGYLHCGEVIVIDISLPGYAPHDFGLTANVIEPFPFLSMFAARPDDAHKGSFGHVLVVGGSPGLTGAPAMSALAALRTGAGLASLAVPGDLALAMEAKLLEVMTYALAQGASGTVADDAIEKVLALLEGKTVLALGPGMGQSPEAARFIAKLLPKLAVPVVIDADALNNIATDTSVLKRCPTDVVITLHPGEMARLIGRDTAAVIADRLGVAASFAQKHGVTVVLKGARSVVATPSGDTWINVTGNPGMATAGAGDVLTGVIAGLIAQHKNVPDCTLLGVYLHGLAGDIANEHVGERGMIASDILMSLPEAIMELEDLHDEQGADGEDDAKTPVPPEGNGKSS